MGPVDAHRSAIANWSDFSGRSSRSEYWWPLPTVIVLSLVAGLSDVALFDRRLDENIISFWPILDAFSLVSTMFLMSLSVRRFHDIGSPGWPAIVGSLLVTFAPLFEIGKPATEFPTWPVIVAAAVSLAFIIVGLIPSNRGSNRFGLNPYAPNAGVFE